MCRFQRGQNALGTRQQVEGFHALGIGDSDILRATGVFQERVLGADAGVIQAGGDGMGFGDLAVIVADHVGAVAVQHARHAGR